MDTQRIPGRVLAVGSSEMEFTADASSASVPDLVQAALAAGSPEVPWDVQAHIVYQMANMPDRCLALAQQLAPEVMMLWLPGAVFSEETVSFAIYHQARPLYRRLRPMVEAGRAIAGGGIEGAASQAAEAAAPIVETDRLVGGLRET